MTIVVAGRAGAQRSLARLERLRAGVGPFRSVEVGREEQALLALALLERARMLRSGARAS